MLPSRLQIPTAARATLLGCALVLAGCEEVDEVRAFVDLDEMTEPVMAASLLSINGTYGTGVTACAGHASNEAWSLEIAAGASLAHPELSVVLNDTTCVLTVTSLVADQTYPAAPAFTLTTSYKVTASKFTFGAVSFYANALLNSAAFANDFAVTVLASNDPVAGIGDDVTALGRAGELSWSGDGLSYQGAYEASLTEPIQDVAGTTYRAITADQCAVRTNGSLWCWGLNTNGEVGTGDVVSPQWSPVQLGSVLTWKQVTTGAGHACATRTDFTLWCWGNNLDGQIGNVAATNPQLTPIQVPGGAVWASVSADSSTTCAIRTSGALYCWGGNTGGQVGNGGVVSPQPTPVLIAGGNVWATVSADWGHTCAIRTNGTLWCWGGNNYGQVGIGSVVTPQSTPIQEITGATTWATVATGIAHTCATRTNGTLWCWGNNNQGEAGQGNLDSPNTSPIQVGTDTTWSVVSAGIYSTCATKTGGTLW
jgi:hypothetical protein